MKCPISKKDFADKANLSKKLDKALKKPVKHLEQNAKERLPFYYEYGYISEKESMIAIGKAKDLHKIYKKRVKGKGEGSEKVDKKKVAFGEVFRDEDGTYKFLVKAGKMKFQEAKKAIKSLKFLKKKIGDKFEILKGEVQEEETPEASPTTDDSSKQDAGALKEMGEKLTKAYKVFRAKELKAFSEKKNSATIKAVLKKGPAISKKMAEFIASAADQGLDDAIATIEAHKAKLDETVGKIQDAVKSAQNKKATGEIDKVAADISASIDELLNAYAADIESIGGLKEALESVKA